jgi:hypothetical protein
LIVKSSTGNFSCLIPAASAAAMAFDKAVMFGDPTNDSVVSRYRAKSRYQSVYFLKPKQ